MKKRLICLTLIVLMIIPIISSCKFKKTDQEKYNYNWDEIITLPSDYNGHAIDVELDAMQAAIDSYLLNAVKEATEQYKYKASRGDDIFVDITVYEEKILTSDNSDEEIRKRGDEIPALSKKDYHITELGKDSLPYQIQLDIINSNLNLSDILDRKYTYEQVKDYVGAEYEGKNFYFTIKIKNKRVELGDVVTVAYKGYHIDDTNNKVKDEKGNEKDPFDTSEGAFFFPGTKLAIDDFENNLVGMLVNEPFSFYATFPDDYSEEEFKGKKVLFEVTINGLYTPPIYNNTFVKTWFNEFDTKSEFEADLKKEFIMTKMFGYVTENSKYLQYPKYEYNLHENEIKDASASFEQYYGYSFDEYIKKSYDMTRDEYIKSQMETEMVYYAIAKKNSLTPTDAMLTNERESLIAYYKSLYMTQQGLDEKTALNTATEFVNNLGETYIYENVMYTMVEEFLYKNAKITEIPKTYESITEVIAKNEAKDK